MPNRLTRVPDAPPPALPRHIDVLVPAADIFMTVMLSRPATGSLRHTWVTPATLWLAALTACAAAAALAGTVVVLGGVAAIVVVAVLALLAAGSLSVAIVGAAQRLHRPPSP